MKKNKALYTSIIITLLLTQLSATNKDHTKQTLSLQDAVTHTLTHSPLTKRSQINREKANLLIKEIKSKSILPEFSLSGETGTIPEARGDIFDSPDKQTDLDGWGPFIKFNLKLVQPLFTFGRKSAALAAAENAVNLKHLQSNTEIEQLTLSTIKTYWALAAAQQAEKTAKEVEKNYDKLEREVKKRLNSEDSEVDDTDLLEVQSNRYQVEEILIKSKMELNLAQKTFNTITGYDITTRHHPANEPPPNFSITEKDVTAILKKSLAQNRDILGIRAAMKALEAKTKLAYADKKPLVYIAGGIAYGYAPHRDDQTNPFAVDNFNYQDIGAFFGFKWDLNIFRKNMEAERQKLEKKSMEQNLVLMKQKIMLDIHKAFAEVKKNQALLTQARTSLKAAKKWLRLGMDNWDMGIGEVDRLIKAYNAYYQLKGIEIKRAYELNTSLAGFAYLLGKTKLYLKWVKHGTVNIL